MRDFSPRPFSGARREPAPQEGYCAPILLGVSGACWSRRESPTFIDFFKGGEWGLLPVPWFPFAALSFALGQLSPSPLYVRESSLRPNLADPLPLVECLKTLGASEAAGGSFVLERAAFVYPVL
eukprot:Gb_28020 [translate_table: standard]